MDLQAATARWERRGDDESFAVARHALDVALAGGLDPRLLVERGFIHEMRAANDLREAIRWYERALEVHPAFELAHYQLVGAYLSLRQANDIIDRYEQRLAADPSDVLAFRCLARAYVAAGRWEAAADTIDAGRSLAPEDTGLLDVEASRLDGIGRSDEALALWQQMLDQDRTSIGGHYSRAFLLERLGRLTEAEAEWEAIIAWSRERGNERDTEWPQRELTRLRLAAEP